MFRLQLFFAIVLLAACGGGGGHVPAPVQDMASAPDDLVGTDLVAPAVWTDTPYLSTTATHKFASAGSATTPGVDYGARIVTDVGTITVDLTESATPLTVNSFVFLARNHFFEGIAFHRVIDDFMAQSGDPNTLAADTSKWGYGGPGYEFDDEIVTSMTFDAAGVLAMANSGPNTNGSQFFITFDAQHSLDGGYTIFGHVIDGAAALPLIARGEPPPTPTRIVSVQIIQR